MARAINKLTDTEVRQTKPEAKEISLSDGGGLYLRIRPSGSKVWVFNYTRPFIKTRTFIGYGNYPSVSLSQARKRAVADRELVSQGIDPKEYREKIEREKLYEIQNTFEAVSLSWKELKSQKVKSNTMANAWQKFELHLLPNFGNYPLIEIKPLMVKRAFNDLEEEGKLETIKRCCQHINEVMVHAVSSGLIEFNHLSDLTKLFPPPKAKHMPTIPPDRLPELMSALKT